MWRVGLSAGRRGRPGRGGEVFFPGRRARCRQDLWQRGFRFQGTYPSGWTTMPFMAAYDHERTTGLYVAVHDPLGSTKDICVESRPSTGRRAVASTIRPPTWASRATASSSSGEAVWQLLARRLVRRGGDLSRLGPRARPGGIPSSTAEGREDTPQWMRELSVLGPGRRDAGASACRDVKEFARPWACPSGFHWYNWHQIPFDNDYPHYFPTKDGFAEAVAELAGVGRLRHALHQRPAVGHARRGTEDFQFTSVGPARRHQGRDRRALHGDVRQQGVGRQPRAAGRHVPDHRALAGQGPRDRAAADERVRREGVYIDQVAAAKPQLCFDALARPSARRRALVDRGLLEAARTRSTQAMPDDRMLTTECNAEPYIHWFDGYLTWHWQYDGQVPAFPAVYGGAIQMFGRAYRGGPTKDLALRMKAGQQLVFGEQIGWINPGVIEREGERGVPPPGRPAAVAACAATSTPARWPGRRKLVGEIPTVTADWQWSGEWPVTTDAVMTGAWRLPTREAAGAAVRQRQRRAGHGPIRFRRRGRYGWKPRSCDRQAHAESEAEPSPRRPSFHRELTFHPARPGHGRSPCSIEVGWGCLAPEREQYNRRRKPSPPSTDLSGGSRRCAMRNNLAQTTFL